MEAKESFWELHRKLAECYQHDVAAGSMAQPPHHVPVHPPLIDRRGSLQRRLSLQSVQKENSMASGVEEAPKSPAGGKPARMVSFDRNSTVKVIDFDEASVAKVIPTASLTPSAEDFTDTARARASLRQRRRSTVEGLLSAQGLLSQSSMGESEDETWDITKVKLYAHKCWLQDDDKDNELSDRLLSLSKGINQSAEQCQIHESELEVPYEMEEHSTMLHPAGVLRTTWNILVAMCLIHDLVVIPLYVFDIPDSSVLIALEWFTQLFWNIDIAMTVRTGYYYKGLLIMDPRKVLRNYVKTWLILDVTLVSLDWAFVILSLSGVQVDSVAQLSRTIRFLRFLRLVRILRWVKLRRMAEVFQELIQSQAASMYWSLLFGIARLIILNHLIACCWFGISRLEGASDNWVTHARLQEDTTSPPHMYAASMNWAFAQLGVGVSDISPRTTLETYFCILIAFRSLITCTTLISRMTSLMTALIKVKEDEEREFRLLRSYLVFNEIPHRLGQKVTRFLQHQFSLKQQAKTADLHVPLLELLSHQLQGELQFARHRASLAKLEFLDHLMDHLDRQILRILHELCTVALDSLPVASKDMVFLGGSQARKTYLVLAGTFTYHHDDGAEKVDAESCGWVAEMCLWTPWVYLGDLVSHDVSRIVAMDASLFGQILSQSPSTHDHAKDYAKNFLSMMRGKTSWTDLRYEARDDNSVGNVSRHASVKKPRASFAPFCCRKKSQKQIHIEELG
ncbi:Hcn2 [Symbiodinium necroappetens]|uniref:Hcn2 protein n=1 Tax=Symbiodinium necroappetens TaxID=1628268 RepID=A0A812YLE7_9DINO|nr:Hcn2 [Symbiodinium necroappetens]